MTDEVYRARVKRALMSKCNKKSPEALKLEETEDIPHKAFVQVVMGSPKKVDEGFNIPI